MISITITGVNGITKKLDQILREKSEELGKAVFKAAKSNTPVKSGNARSKWKRKTTGVGNKDFQVENNTPYIGRLEAGASKQAPKGIIGPTLTQVKGKYK